MDADRSTSRIAETARVKHEDPAPFAWLDGSSWNRSGPMPDGVTAGTGVVFVVLYGICVGVNPDGLSPVTFLAPSPFLLLGLVLIFMVIRRRAWRGRHPGIDPYEASTMPEGGPFTDTRLRGSIMRWICLIFCFAFALFALLVMIVALVSSAPLADKVVVTVIALFLGTPMALIGVLSVGVQRTPTDPDRARGLSGSMFGGTSRLARVSRVVFLVPALLIGLVAALSGGLILLGRSDLPDHSVVGGMIFLVALVALCGTFAAFDIHRMGVVHAVRCEH